jgi:hypothetical protein
MAIHSEFDVRYPDGTLGTVEDVSAVPEGTEILGNTWDREAVEMYPPRRKKSLLRRLFGR